MFDLPHQKTLVFLLVLEQADALMPPGKLYVGCQGLQATKDLTGIQMTQ